MSDQAAGSSGDSRSRFAVVFSAARWMYRWVGVAVLFVVVLNLFLKLVFIFWNPTLLVGTSLRAVRSSPAWKDTPENVARLIDMHEAMGRPGLAPYFGHYDRPFTSEYVNVTSDCQRKTTQNPAPRPSAKRVCVFGGSTAWGYGVSDSNTMPSRLQAMLGPDYDVQNMATLAWQSAQETHRLMELLAQGGRPDIVIFYDGFNDKLSAINNGGDPRCPLLWKGFDFSYNATWAKMITRTPLGNILRALAVRKAAKLHSSEFAGKTDELASRIAGNWLANRELVRALGDKYGFRSYFFWQPDLFSNPPSKSYAHYERMRTSTHGIGAAAHLEAMSPVLAKSLGGREAEGIYRLDSILGGIEESVYLDFCHLNQQGNEIIATAIRDALSKDGAIASTR